MTVIQYIKSSRSYLTLIMTSVCMIAFSCAQDDTGKPNGEEKEVVFILNTRKAASGTRASVDFENYINTVEVLVFEENGKYLYTSTGRDISNAGSDTKSFSATLRVVEGKKCDLVVLANSREHIMQSFGGAIPPNTPRATVLEKLTATHTVKWETDSDDPGFKYIPMYGQLDSVEIKEVMSPVTMTIDMVRLLARVDISLQTGITNFTIESAYAYNYNTKGKIIPDPAKWNGTQVSGPTLPSGSSTIQGPLNFEITPGTKTEKEIYLFEAAAGTDNLTANTCIVIGGKYDGELSYYRIDLGNTNSGGQMEFLDIRRNYRYDIEIDKVSGPGFPDPDRAFRSQRYGLGYNVTGWADGYDYQYGEGGQHQLDISSTMLEIPASAASHSITIKTTHPDGWNHRLSTSATTITGSVSWITKTTLSDTPAQNVPVSLTLEVAANTLTSARTGYIHITSGNLTNIITVKQQGK